jgi:hypothetical protein
MSDLERTAVPLACGEDHGYDRCPGDHLVRVTEHGSIDHWSIEVDQRRIGPISDALFVELFAVMEGFLAYRDMLPRYRLFRGMGSSVPEVERSFRTLAAAQDYAVPGHPEEWVSDGDGRWAHYGGTVPGEYFIITMRETEST